MKQSPNINSHVYYDFAFNEIANMLDGKQDLSISRSVFLAEWAYFEGNLDYKTFNDTIKKATSFIRNFIAANQLEKYKTGKNMALIEFFFNPYSGNGYKPFMYDFNAADSTKDFTQQFVTKVMQTHYGQCRSLPYYYRILAEAIDAESYIAYAPAHVFIRYRDDDNLFPEDWVNVELTSHQLQPEFAIKDGFDISDKMIQNKIYLCPITATETVAAQLCDLALGYRTKYDVYDYFTLSCVNKALEYYPQHPNSLLIKTKSLEAELMKHLQFNGYLIDEYTTNLENQIIEINKQLANLGWKPMSVEILNKLEENGKRLQNIQINKR